ncbi:MAG: flagellar hook-basal body complex protein [Rhodospirillaceae bacterium]|jgi:flagellar hook protein FlgE|nr:flagellar hook-basal body complex protein [Rhodospirillaceae bacterium]MBT4589139.1 flagellar hook-basal body complex protein [Rhodospirillaceae bacterium]MBT4938347.1 flagellar hook-basal body complex protein [Rhodospirillaceae bacterium]MBT5941365.1 flagellar hook-basal body complex protein [Rhodospirillaceae bacterium]MBT7268522.1 flagellar hook-basal body complex protein [Rhodospirillaceae bacterium]
MPMYGAFTAPILGMLAQTSAFGSISQNISNMNTGGYKAHDTKFSTILATTYSNNRDIGGLTANTRNFIEQQGRIISSTNNLDLAISGKGLYILNTESDGSGDTFYTRDGGFSVNAGDEATDADNNTYNESYITDKNGYFLQGWVADGTGEVTPSSTTSSLRIDSQAFNTGGAADAAASTTASIAANLPATTSIDGTYTTKGSVFDSAGTSQSLELVWERNEASQEWDLWVVPDGSTFNQIKFTDYPSNTTEASPTATYTFSSTGGLPDNTTTTVSYTASDSTAVSFTLDVSDITSIGSEFLYFDFQKDGRTAGVLDSFKFDESGKIIGRFTNGLEETLYKIPLATFANADTLDRFQGNLFQESTTSGTSTLIEVRANNADVDIFHEFAHFIPFAHELSNTNLQNEFTHMIMSQQAYNSSATVFKSLDEMTRQAANLKT